MSMRTDFDFIEQWINPGSRILDLACGDGTLLKNLQLHKQVEGYGLEIDQDNITAAISNGVNVVETDLDSGLSQFPDNSFDAVCSNFGMLHFPDPEKALYSLSGDTTFQKQKLRTTDVSYVYPLEEETALLVFQPKKDFIQLTKDPLCA